MFDLRILFVLPLIACSPVDRATTSAGAGSSAGTVAPVPTAPALAEDRLPPISFARIEASDLEPAVQERWEWPGESRFEADWRAGGMPFGMTRGVGLLAELPPHLHGAAVGDLHDWAAAQSPKDELAILLDADGRLAGGFGESETADNLEGIREPLAGAWRGGRYVASFRTWAVVFEGPPPPDEPPSDLAWAEWSYTTTLLDGPEPRSRPPEGTAAEVEEADLAFTVALALPGADALPSLRDLVDAPMYASSRHWHDASERARSHGDLDLAIALRSRYSPAARCSMDRAPQRAGLDYAELCAEAGRTACYLQLLVAVMGNNFGTFMIRSSYGDAAAPTYAGRVAEIGIDGEQFLLGLVFAFDSERERNVGLGTWRIGRAMAETNADRFRALLTGHVEDVGLDDYNRLRATWALVGLEFHAAGAPRSGPERAAFLSRIERHRDGLSLTPEAEAYLDRTLDVD